MVIIYICFFRFAAKCANQKRSTKGSELRILQLTRNLLSSLEFIFQAVGFDLVAISFSSVLALGAIWLLSSFFEEDDDDQDGGGLGSPVYVPAYAGNPT